MQNRHGVIRYAQKGPLCPEGSQPQLQVPNLYEKLREQGDSKEKAAHISNAAPNRGRFSVGKPGGLLPPYEDWIVKDLMNRAK